MLTPEPKAVYRWTDSWRQRRSVISVLTPEPKAVYFVLSKPAIIGLESISVLTPEPKAVYNNHLRKEE